jgi:hypothetical protein
MTKHSPGPFTVEYSPFKAQDDREIPSFRIFDADGDQVAETDSGKPEDMQQADADLLAASPAMLAALEQAVTALNTVMRFPVPRLLTDSYAVAATCEAAIAQAKGGAA